MAHLIQKAVQSAYKTFVDFAHSGTTVTLQQRIPKLTELLGSLTAHDISFDERLVENTEVHNPHLTDAAPVTYIHLWEDKVMSVGVFVMKNGVSIPLHDHPRMYGLLKVLHGSVHLTAYSECDFETRQSKLVPDMHRQLSQAESEGIKFVSRSTDCIANANSDPCFLSPNDSNFHQITSVDGPAAFLDILAPPYDHRHHTRECHYYRELNAKECIASSDDQKTHCFLLPVSQPSEFWCDSAPYKGPKISLDKNV